MTPIPHAVLFTEPADLSMVREWLWDYLGKLAGRYPGEDIVRFVHELERVCSSPSSGVYPRLAHDNGLYTGLLLERPLAFSKTRVPVHPLEDSFARLAMLPELLEAGLMGLERVDRLVLPNPDLL